jgi:5-methylthioribose kinase
MADTLLPMTDLVMDAEQKKQNVKFYTNPELCKITEDLVLTEPYYDYKGGNIIFPGNEDFVEKELYSDTALHTEVAKLRLNYMNNAQTLLHGDLHSGSIFINEKGIKVLDPEFAFYGPAGYDIGNVIGNLFFALASRRYAGDGSAETEKCAADLEKCIEDVYDMTKEKLTALYDEIVEFPLYRTEGFRKMWIDDVMADSAGYAGTEIIRRTVGDSKVMEVTSVTDPDKRIPMERALIKLGKALIMKRYELQKGSGLTALL